MTPMTPVPDAAPPPEAADLACPLCGYSLRGLTTPRCPECGFAFTWAELVDANRDRHPWLFEHGRGRDVRTFVSTYARTALPRWFWAAVTPAHSVVVRRLLAYWVVTAVVAVIAIAAQPSFAAGREAWANLRVRLSATPNEDGLLVQTPTGSLLTTAGEMDANYPAPWTATFWRDLFRRWRSPYSDDVSFTARAVSAAVVVAWPWLTLAALLAFRPSMRLADVRTGHVLRSAVYGGECGLPVAAALLGWAFLRQWSPVRTWLWEHVRPALLTDTTIPILAAVALTAAVAGRRLTAAYGRYLRFPQPARAVAASQLIVVLVVAIPLVFLPALFD